jgi:hypothetical protein
VSALEEGRVAQKHLGTDNTPDPALAQDGLNLRSSCLSLQDSWDYRNGPQHPKMLHIFYDTRDPNRLLRKAYVRIRKVCGYVTHLLQWVANQARAGVSKQFLKMVINI